jgi:hypothetical protein
MAAAVVATAATGAGGCTIDIGPGKINPVVIEEEVDLAEADGTTDPAGMTSFSMTEDIEFLSADDAADLDRRYGDKLHAVDAIDVRLDDLTVQRSDDGSTPPGLVLDLVLDGVILTVGQRARLPAPWIGRLQKAVHAHQALTVPMVYTLTVQPEDANATLAARATVQPIMIVNIAEAL